MNGWPLYILLLIVVFTIARVIKRNFFWKTRDGEELTFKQFLIRWKRGIVEITPLQQTKTNLWSMIPIFSGIIWGIVVTFIGEFYWMTLILSGSLPLTSVQFISNLQKYKSQKIAYNAYNEAMKPTRKRVKKK